MVGRFVKHWSVSNASEQQKIFQVEEWELFKPMKLAVKPQNKDEFKQTNTDMNE